MTTNEAGTISELFDAITLPDTGTVDRLHERLVDKAEREELLDLSYRTVDSPYGPLLVAATAQGLVRVAFDLEGHDAVLARLAASISPRILRGPRRLDRVAAQLDEYFAGRRHHFELPIDLQLAHGFRRTVLDRLCHISYGATATYAAIAAAAGSPAAVRAVGSACATNPLPIVVPCHRVVRSDGSIGQYLGGTETKRALLAMESA
ncbi:MAG TPA: methylated-DNA--[protein]-cysteine S-methyltransferase [Acidimicrobiales bacterium]|nr:methylated-DNA--[protein]-cysteine S-methyltransferase [Acidimicrobiales bacterium]